MTTARMDADERPRRSLSGADNPLVRAVGGIRASVLAKLLVAFASTVVLLVLLGVVSLGVIRDSNDRVKALGDLQERTAAYRQLQTDAKALQTLLKLRAGTIPDGTHNLTFPEFANPQARLVLDRLLVSFVAGEIGATDISRLGFTPPADEQPALTQIEEGYAKLLEVVTTMATIDEVGLNPAGAEELRTNEAAPLAKDTRSLIDQVLASVKAKTGTQILDNQGSFTFSQVLLVSVAVASVALALLLGYILSWSIVGPIRRMERRLAGIATGDFSGHVDVRNRDELGSLASDLNRMNDELGRLYKELESASQHKSEFLANMSHELRTPLNAIIGFSQVLQQQMYGELNDRQAGYVEDVLSSGQHLLNLINDILDLSKVEAGRMELQRTTFDLPAMLEKIGRAHV